MKSRNLLFLGTLIFSLEFSHSSLSLGSKLSELKDEEKTTSAQTTQQERRKERGCEEHADRTSDTREEIPQPTDIDEERDLSELTLHHFRTALKQFPDAERFILKKASDGSILLLPEAKATADPSKSILEDQLTRQAFQLVLQASFPTIDVSSFFEEDSLFPTPAIGAKRIQEILSLCERSESLEHFSKKGSSFLAQTDVLHSTTSSGKSKNVKTGAAWNWRSAILPSTILFLSKITQGTAQPFAHQTSFGCPNGTEMGIVWEHFSSLQLNNTSQNYPHFIPSSCVAAEHLT